MKLTAASASLLKILLSTVPLMYGIAFRRRRSTPGLYGEHLGSVAFSVSCLPSVQAQFNRGVALLHDFWYEEAPAPVRKNSQPIRVAPWHIGDWP